MTAPWLSTPCDPALYCEIETQHLLAVVHLRFFLFLVDPFLSCFGLQIEAHWIRYSGNGGSESDPAPS